MVVDLVQGIEQSYMFDINERLFVEFLGVKTMRYEIFGAYMSNDAQWFSIKGFYKNSSRYPVSRVILLKHLKWNVTDEEVAEKLKPHMREFSETWGNHFDWMEWERVRDAT